MAGCRPRKSPHQTFCAVLCRWAGPAPGCKAGTSGGEDRKEGFHLGSPGPTPPWLMLGTGFPSWLMRVLWVSVSSWEMGFTAMQCWRSRVESFTTPLEEAPRGRRAGRWAPRRTQCALLARPARPPPSSRRARGAARFARRREVGAQEPCPLAKAKAR